MSGLNGDNQEVDNLRQIALEVVGNNLVVPFGNLRIREAFNIYLCGTNDRPLYPETSQDVYSMTVVGGDIQDDMQLITKKDSAMSLLISSVVLLFILA